MNWQIEIKITNEICPYRETVWRVNVGHVLKCKLNDKDCSEKNCPYKIKKDTLINEPTRTI